MTAVDGVLGLIGRTPLLRLRAASEETGCEILGKAEFLNPGGSVKDRAALGIVRDAERSGALKPGGTIVEGTAGNTASGLALVGNALGYKTVIVMPPGPRSSVEDAPSTTDPSLKRPTGALLGCAASAAAARHPTVAKRANREIVLFVFRDCINHAPCRR